jgi:hypothetical protein
MKQCKLRNFTQLYATLRNIMQHATLCNNATYETLRKFMQHATVCNNASYATMQLYATYATMQLVYVTYGTICNL